MIQLPEIKIDKEFQSLIPPLSQDEYKQLEANVISDGCRDALVVWQGTLIDGHNRYKICTEHNIPFQTVEKKLNSREDAVQWIILNQFGRRNLSPGNRSILALRLEPIFKEKAKKRAEESRKEFHGNQHESGMAQKSAEYQKGTQKSANLNAPVETRKEVAKIAGVSHDTIDKVKKIIDHGTPEQVERIKKGDKGNTVNAVYKEILKTKAPEEKKPKASLKAIVTELKDNEKDTSLTPKIFLQEYRAFAEETVHRFEWYKQSMYTDLYPNLSKADMEKVTALNTAMLRAVEEINKLQKG